jgi:hypothetical protein
MPLLAGFLHQAAALPPVALQQQQQHTHCRGLDGRAVLQSAVLASSALVSSSVLELEQLAVANPIAQSYCPPRRSASSPQIIAPFVLRPQTRKRRSSYPHSGSGADGGGGGDGPYDFWGLGGPNDGDGSGGDSPDYAMAWTLVCLAAFVQSVRFLAVQQVRFVRAAVVLLSAFRF